MRDPLEAAEAVACGVGVQLSELSGVTTNGTPLRRPRLPFWQPEGAGIVRLNPAF